MPEQLSRAVAAEVRRLLDDRGWSGRELARRTGMTQGSVARKLGDQHPFDVDDLQAVCAALGVDVADLMAWAQRG